MRRFAAVMNHRSAGFKANAMGVWAVPEEQLDEIGPQMAGFAAVSHCYRRPTYDDWPYSVFTMVHGRSARDCEATIDAIRDRDRRRRVLPALVGQGVQEGARCATSLPSGTSGAPRTSKTRSDPAPETVAEQQRADRGRDPRQAARRGCRRGEEDRLLVGELGVQPASFMRSFATTHGYARYGTTEGGASPRPLLQSICNHRSAASSGSAGRVPARNQRVGVLRRQPTVGRDVVDARSASCSTATSSARATSSTCTTCTGAT